jgi:hypothetical protein
MIEIDKELEVPKYSPVCTFCKNFIISVDERKCKAFPKGIPMDIWVGKFDHIKKHPDQDNDIVFKPREQESK